MGFYQSHVLPRVIDKACGIREIDELRPRVAAGLAGRVVEIGFGSGLNLPHLPPEVDELLAVDPATVGRRLARARLADSPVAVEFVGLDGAQLPLDDGTVDGALSTFTLCTIPDVELALQEVHRVLRPGGELHLLEHGLSTDPPVARWQHRLTPLQRRLLGGCHLDRPIAQLVEQAGFELVRLDTSYLRGPRPMSYLYLGVARKAA